MPLVYVYSPIPSELNEFPDSEAAIIIEYDHCKFAFEISLLVDTYQLLVEVVPGHIEDPWDCLVADDRSWHWRNDLSSPIRCEIKKKLVEPLVKLDMAGQ